MFQFQQEIHSKNAQKLLIVPFVIFCFLIPTVGADKMFETLDISPNQNI